MGIKQLRPPAQGKLPGFSCAAALARVFPGSQARRPSASLLGVRRRDSGPLNAALFLLLALIAGERILQRYGDKRGWIHV